MLGKDLGRQAADAAERLHGGRYAAKGLLRADVQGTYQFLAQLLKHSL